MNKNKSLNVLIAGTGGQGTVLAARLIAESALDAGLDVRGSETIGMAQRGGSVLSHIRIAKETALWSPLISPGQADVLIGFEPAEAARAAPFLKPDGFLITQDRAVKPASGDYDVDAVLGCLKTLTSNFIIEDGGALAAKYGSRCINVALLGLALRAGVFPFEVSAVEKIMLNRLPPEFWEQNKKALYLAD